MITNGNSLLIVPDSSRSRFPQQGQLDLVTFGNTTISAFLSVLRRLSAAGVQTVTHCGGLHLGNSFLIGEMGEHRMEEVIGNLRTVSGFDKVLYFGFGYMNHVRIILWRLAAASTVWPCARALVNRTARSSQQES